MTRPLLFITSYTGMGGGETSLLTLADHLDPKQWAPHLLTPRGGQLPEAFRARGWPAHVIPFRGASTWFVPAVYARFPIVGKLEALLREQGIAAVHSDYHSIPFALPAARHVAIPLVWMCHGWWFHPKPWQRGFFQLPDAGFAVSWTVRDGFLGQPPFMQPERLPVLPLGVDTRRFRPGLDGSNVRSDAGIAADTPLVALIARFQSVKGHEVFQAMIREIAPQMPDVHFVVAGENVHGRAADDAYRARVIRAWESDPVLHDRLTYLGFRSDPERVIAAADVVVCSSQFESYGMVAVETMASGKPIVSTRRGGPSETIAEGETGFLVDAGDAVALADRTIRLLRDPVLRQRMGEAGRARVDAHFSARAMASHFMEVMERLTEPRQESV
ncbi:MAG: glycosyltransferase family 4 protein [Anaerolineae bacterium]